MDVNLLYRGLYSTEVYRDKIEVFDESSLKELKRMFECNFPRVSDAPNDVDIFTFMNGKNPHEFIFKWKLFPNGKISEIAQLVAIEEI